MTKAQLHIIGLPVTDGMRLCENAQQALQACTVVIGAARQLALVENYLENQQHVILPKLSELLKLLTEYSQHNIAFLASGDAFYFGIGRWLTNNITQFEITSYPAVSSIQAACHALHLSLQDCEVVSLHGRPLATLNRHLAKSKTLILLTDAKSHPQAIAQQCVSSKFTESEIIVCEDMAYPQQNIQSYKAADLVMSETTFSELNVVVVKPKTNNHFLPTFPGIADESFITDGDVGKGLLTKREVRLQILALLALQPNDIAWDIGAGCGGVAIEWALWHEHSDVYAIERHPQRLAYLKKNRERFGVLNNLNIVEGEAPLVLQDLPRPNKVFIGGSGSHLNDLLQCCWDQLPAGGVMLVSAVTEQTKMHCLSFADEVQACQQSIQLAISRQDSLAGKTIYRPQLPVVLYQWLKPSA